MRVTLSLVAAAAALWGADPVKLNVKPGNWEITTTTKTVGKAPIPKEILSKMTPEQRSRYEAARAKEPNSATNTSTEQKCLSAQELSKPFAPSDDQGCKSTLVASTATKMEARISCESMGVHMNGNMKAEAGSPESIKFIYEMKSGDGANTMTLSANATGKWLGPNCSEDKK